jgi:molybdopterin-guanine dinucleotide biosynthesis protein A
MLSLAILAGGTSSRMGQDKALMPLLGRPLITHILERLSPIADEIIISTNSPSDYSFLDIPILPDLQPGTGALGGLYTALNAAKYPFVAAVACDMPFASRSLFEYELDFIVKTEADVVIPSTPEGLEPLHAIYHRETCLPVVQSALGAKSLKLTGWLPEVNFRLVPPEVILQFDPEGLAFWNLNTPEEFLLAEARVNLENE